MGIVSLEGVEFYSFHGVYDEERKIGNRFSIDIAVESDISLAGKTDSLQDTVDYEVLYKLIAGVMSNPVALLEHLADQIISLVRSTYPTVGKVTVKISKLNPPIGGICQRASITLEG